MTSYAILYYVSSLPISLVDPSSFRLFFTKIQITALVQHRTYIIRLLSASSHTIKHHTHRKSSVTPMRHLSMKREKKPSTVGKISLSHVHFHDVRVCCIATRSYGCVYLCKCVCVSLNVANDYTYVAWYWPAWNQNASTSLLFYIELMHSVYVMHMYVNTCTTAGDAHASITLVLVTPTVTGSTLEYSISLLLPSLCLFICCTSLCFHKRFVSLAHLLGGKNRISHARNNTFSLCVSIHKVFEKISLVQILKNEWIFLNFLFWECRRTENIVENGVCVRVKLWPRQWTKLWFDVCVARRIGKSKKENWSSPTTTTSKIPLGISQEHRDTLRMCVRWQPIKQGSTGTFFLCVSCLPESSQV